MDKKTEALKLAHILDYDPETGVFTWKVRRGSKGAGTTATYKNTKGYVGICIDRKHMKAHRVAWGKLVFRWEKVESRHQGQWQEKTSWIL